MALVNPTERIGAETVPQVEPNLAIIFLAKVIAPSVNQDVSRQASKKKHVPHVLWAKYLRRGSRSAKPAKLARMQM